MAQDRWNRGQGGHLRSFGTPNFWQLQKQYLLPQISSYQYCPPPPNCQTFRQTCCWVNRHSIASFQTKLNELRTRNMYICFRLVSFLHSLHSHCIDTIYHVQLKRMSPFEINDEKQMLKLAFFRRNYGDRQIRSTNFDDKSLSANFFHKVKVFRDS